MIRLLKTMLLLFMVLALPVQGLAAAMKASCGPGHHSALSVTVAEDHHHDADAAQEHHHHDGGHESSVQHASIDSQPAPDDEASSGKTAGQSAYCSACAACCVGAVAPPSVSFLTPAYSSSENVVVSPSPLVTGHVPAGLERPPKPISA
ncbi:hypothetical protein D3870_02605 [Noviherbaspirillum cavernae]|uniref:Cobalt transporter n=1 Tax=Noviherbaspirillum cavernae TaxID=2320862 RepID=A0A418WXU7_9BURK|nr:hypothetical protein [Noviherbaspirillum cavernae]RJG05056.1 hypothetical protein D3870_02605 [Noviherbaspirillum cavernae]